MLLGSSQSRSVWLVAFSFLVAACLDILPVGWLRGYFQPDWVALVLIYWCIHDPDRYGAGIGWLSGLLIDLLDYGILGKYALGKTVLGFLANKISLRLRVYPLWQQCLGVAVLIFVDVIVHALVRFLLEQPTLSIARWLTPLSSMVMWPLVVVILTPRARTRRY